MPKSIPAARRQLARVYDLMYVEGQPGYEQVTFDERMFSALSELLDLLPDDGVTELLYRLSEDVPPIKVAELYNVLIWSADTRGTIDAEELQEWFYGRRRRRIEIACRIDLYPSNSMDESERILEELTRRYPDLDYLLRPLRESVEAQQREERMWSDYRRDTFAMPREMTPDIMNIIKHIKLR